MILGNNMIHNNNNNLSDSQQQQPSTSNTNQRTSIVERIIPLPSVLIDFMAMTLCDLIPPRKVSARRRQSLPNLSSSTLHHPQIIMPELVYFIQKITFQAGIQCRTALVALIYLNRAKQLLPKGAVGGHDTCHRLFLASILVATKFLRTDDDYGSNMTATRTTGIPSTWSHYYYHPLSSINSIIMGPLTNRKLSEICGGGLFPLHEINQLERAFLKLIQYQCWVDDKEIQDFVVKHRVDFSL